MSWSRIEFYQNSSVCVYTSWESDVTKMATSVIPGFIVYMRTTDTYSRTGYHWENGRTGGETEAPPASPRKPGFPGRIRGAATYWPDRLPWAVATLHRGLPWAPGEASRKREPGETSNLPQHCGWLYGSPSSDLTQWGSPGNLWAKSLGIWLWQRGGEGSATPSTWILANRVPAYRVQVIVPTSSFAHLQNQVRSHSDQETGRGKDLPDWDPQMRSFAGPGARFAHSQARCGGCPQPHLIKKCWWQLLAAVWLSNIQAKRRAGRLAPRANPVPGFSPLQVNFCEWHKIWAQFLLHMDIQLSQHHLLKRLFFSFWIFLASF